MLLSRRDAVLAMLFSSVPWKSRADVLFVPEDRLFSAKFPIEPEKKTSEKDGVMLTFYGSRVGRKVFSIADTFWPTATDPMLAIQSIMDGLIERVSAELLSFEKVTFASEDGKKLMAKRFTYASSKLWGGGLAVAAGRHSLFVQVAKAKPSEGFDSTDDQFISSFKVLS
jgi:hypothetical protein